MAPDVVHHRLRAVARLFPTRVAVRSGDVELTYGELEARADRLAHRLCRGGVEPETPVGVLVDKASVDFVVTIVAIWKAGAAYVPMDPRTPAAQVRELVDRLGPTAFLLDGTIGGSTGEPWVAPRVAADQLAYIVHTSGSSGAAKPVAVTHRALVSVYLGWADRYGLAAHAPTCLQAAGPAFDVHIGDIVRALLSGGCLVLCEPHVVLDPPLLVGLVDRASVDVVELTPTVWRLITRWLDRTGRSLPTVRLVMSGGEQMTVDDYRGLRRSVAPGTGIVNSYGVAEATIDSTYLYVTEDVLQDGDPVPIGHPFPGTAVAVLDEHRQRIPPGGTGELYLAGAGLARGYHRRPALTAERFLPAAAGLPGSVMYRTGDVVRQRDDGAIVYIGRTDDEVKVRGVRIPLGAVESALLALPVVDQAVVTRAERAGEGVLVAHLVPTGDAMDWPPDRLRAYLETRMPAAMVPAELAVHPRMPLSPSGKADRRALAGDTVLIGRSAVEDTVVRAWREVLGRPPRDRDANLFADGGTSLTAARLVAELRDRTGADLSVAMVFATPTVAGLCRALESAARAAPIAAVGGDEAPLAPGQRGLWLLDRLRGGDPAYHIPMLLRLAGPLDRVALRSALDGLVARHDALRIAITPDGRAQQIGRPVPFPLELHDGDDGRSVLDELVHRPFDLGRAPLIRGALIRHGKVRHELAIVAHHIVFDDWSERVLLRDLGELYSGRVPAVPAVRYVDVAAWHAGAVDGTDREYWPARLADLPAPLDLPAAPPGLPRGTPATRSAGLPPVLADRVRAVAAAHGVTPYVVLLMAFTVLLRRWAGQDDTVVGVPFGYRDRPETRGLVGFLVSTLPLRPRFAPGATFVDALHAVRDELAGATAHAGVPFDRMVREAGLAGGGDRNPVFRAWFNWLGAPADPPAMDGLAVEVTHLTVCGALFDLAVYVTEGPGGYRLDAVVDRSVVDARYLGPLLDQYTRLVDRLCAAPGDPVSAPPLRATGGGTGTADLRRAVPSLVDTLLAVAVRSADRAAVGSTTYHELYRQAGGVAAALRAHGIGPRDTVPIYAERTERLVPALLGVLGSGAAFTILDAAHPPARLATQLAVARARVGLRLGRQPPRVMRDACPQWLDVAAGVGPWPLEPAGRYAYLAFTSGTGGGPKPVRGGPEPLAHFLAWYTDRFQLGPDDRFAMLAGLGHDPLLRDILAPLWVGGALCVPPGELMSRPRELRAWLHAEAVTVLHLTPAFGRLLGTPGDAAVLAGVRLVLCGGDALYGADVAAIRRWAPTATLVNVYGTTETPQVLSFHEIRHGVAFAERVPVGSGAPGAELLVLDASGRPAAVGERGRIVARSAFLADSGGVVDDPLFGHRRFPTGDLGRVGPDGEVTVLGRADDQVQVRGFRVELTEVDRCLLGHPDVADAACRVLPGPGGETGLVAYVVPRGGADSIADRIRAFVRRSLPEYMVPARIVPVASIPLTPNRKPDRAALPVPVPEPLPGIPPQTDLERFISEIWRDVLRVGQIGVDRNFFDLGATSVTLVHAQTGLEAALARSVPLTALFEHTTVRTLAAHLAGNGVEAPGRGPRREVGDLRSRRFAARRSARDRESRRG